MFIIFTKNLKKYREKTDLSKAELARLLGLKYNTYNNYEMGTGEPKLDTLVKIADILNVSLDDLLGRTPTNEDEQLEKIINEGLKNGNCTLLKLSKIDSDSVFFDFDNIIKDFELEKKFIIDNLNKIKFALQEKEKLFQSRFFKFIQDTAFISLSKEQINAFQKLIDNTTDIKIKEQLKDDLYKQIVLTKMFEEQYNKDYPDYLQENK